MAVKSQLNLVCGLCCQEVSLARDRNMDAPNTNSTATGLDTAIDEGRGAVKQINENGKGKEDSLGTVADAQISSLHEQPHS